MWWKKFKIYARDNYGVDVTDDEAQASREAFFELYPGFPEWHNKQRRFAQVNGYVRSLSGRKRRLPAAMGGRDTPERREAQRQAINSPVQSFANELNLMAALQMRKEFSRKWFHLVGTVHDAVLIEVREDMVEHVYNRGLEIMSEPELLTDFEIELNVPIEAEAKIGAWSTGKGLKKWLAEQLLIAEQLAEKRDTSHRQKKRQRESA
jgi:DNA polymerase I-like protein with 3'-5' exonuclease and polymerase domains